MGKWVRERNRMHVGAGVACCVVAAICIGASVVPESPAQADQASAIVPLPHRVDNVPEDSPEFDCRIDGNQICGPDNDLGVAPGYWGFLDFDPCILGFPADQTYYADGTPAPALPCAEAVIPFGPQQ
ncbi:hypothetical protein [Nocardia nova]|uniref:hypothetical protein n=1 Tax=Nocardia nova TaxID=37330 RepID=UPI0027398251|nr:hypothetical protein [Nocardia nova]